jgi:hypothetical protein
LDLRHFNPDFRSFRIGSGRVQTNLTFKKNQIKSNSNPNRSNRFFTLGKSLPPLSSSLVARLSGEGTSLLKVGRVETSLHRSAGFGGTGQWVFTGRVRTGPF